MSKEKIPIDFKNSRFCARCGEIVEINSKLCEFCYTDLTVVPPIGGKDEIAKNLAITALTDPNPKVRKKAVDSLGDLGDIKVIGVLAYILLNDLDADVRREAADELGDRHHEYSLEVLKKAKKDESSIVREEAVAGIKKIKRKEKVKKKTTRTKPLKIKKERQEKESRLKGHTTTLTRRIIQIVAFLVINYVILEFIFSINLKTFEGLIKILPILNSPRNPLSKGAGFIEFIFYFLTEGEFPFFIISLFILIILFTNRFFCGWICPIGTIQDGLAAIKGTKKVKIKAHNWWVNVKYGVIILLIIAIVPLGVTKTTDLIFYFQYKQNLGDMASKPVAYFSLSEYIFVFFPNLIEEMWESASIQPLFTDFLTFILFMFYLILLIVAIYIPRVYCRYFCPFGAVASAISDYSFLKLSRSPVRCVGRAACGICERRCPKQIRILDEPFEFFTGKGECNFCLSCKEACPYKALSTTFG